MFFLSWGPTIVKDFPGIQVRLCGCDDLAVPAKKAVPQLVHDPSRQRLNASWAQDHMWEYALHECMQCCKKAQKQHLGPPNRH